MKRRVTHHVQRNRRLSVLIAVHALCVILVLSSNALANVIGPDAQNFNPITSGLDFVTVQSSETLKPGIFNFGTFLNYAVNFLDSTSTRAWVWLRVGTSD